MRFGIMIYVTCVMTIGDHEVQIFLSHPHTYNGFFLLFTIKFHFSIFKKRFPEILEYAKM